MTSVWDKYFVPFDSILINNSCKYFLHLQLFSEYEEVLNTLWSYMRKKKLSDETLKPFENMIAPATTTAVKKLPSFKLFTVGYSSKVKDNLLSKFASIIWDQISQANNRVSLNSFFSAYFAIGDVDLLPTPFNKDMNETDYGKNILKQYINDMISIYGKEKGSVEIARGKKRYGLVIANNLSGFLHAIVNIVLFCKLKEKFSEEKDCYDNNLFNQIIKDFEKEIKRDDEEIKQKGDGDDPGPFLFMVRRKLDKHKDLEPGKTIGKIDKDDTTIIYKELLRRANQNDVRITAKKDLIKHLQIDLKNEDLTRYIYDSAYRRLMKLMLETGLQNIKKTSGENLVYHIDSIYTKLERNEENPTKMLKQDFKTEFYDR